MIAAPLLLLASSIAYALGDGSGEDQTGGAIQVYAATAFVFVVIGLARATEAAFPRAATVLTLIGVLGSVGGATFGVTSIATRCPARACRTSSPCRSTSDCSCPG